MRNRWIAAAVVIALSAGTLQAQDKPGAQPSGPPAQPGPMPATNVGAVPLKVTVVLSRYQGDKRLSNLPYVLAVTTSRPTSLRMGIEVPVSMSGSKTGSISYRTVGTNIDCRADTMTGNTFLLSLTVEDSSINLTAQQKPMADATSQLDLPRFRAFNTSFSVLLRDNQTIQYQSATDPVTGEVMKIDVTLNVVK